jgi:hypothetical protein
MRFPPFVSVLQPRLQVFERCFDRLSIERVKHYHVDLKWFGCVLAGTFEAISHAARPHPGI